MSAQIKIVRVAMNTDRDHALGLVFKLEYVFPNLGQPRLQVFLDNELSQSQDWPIYGVDPRRTELFLYLEFEALRQIRHFELGRRFQIEFTHMTLEEIEYSRSGKMFEPAYHFRVDACNG